MNLKDVKRVYCIGVGGIGMSALARYFLQTGAQVSGYDKMQTALTKQLIAEGVQIHFEDNINLLDREADCVIYTPAIPADHQELNWYKEHNYPLAKRSEVLSRVLENKYTIAIAGTHGKTTMSAMTAYLLRESGVGCHAFLGGISVNYQTNYWSSSQKIAVVEADEYDRSFLKLVPDIAVLSAMDPDHLDIYGTAEAMEEAFLQFANSVREDGLLLVKHGLKRTREMKHSNFYSYSLQNDAADYYASDIRIHNGGYRFNIHGPKWYIQDIHLQMGGMHNVENMVAALAVAHKFDIQPSVLKEIIPGFRGVKRRFEYVVMKEDQVYIDDYAHHPEELAALIQGAKRMFPGKKCVLAFQPHLYSRTRDLATAFAHSLDMADEVILLDIYPAREKPMDGVTSSLITQNMENPAHNILSKEGLLTYIKHAKPELFITAGAGDIDQLVPEIKKIMIAA